MNLSQLNKRDLSDKKTKQRFAYYEQLIGAIGEKDLPDELILKLNQEIELINTSTEPEKQFSKLLFRSKTKIYKLLEKEAKIVPRSFYSTRWLAIGMVVFGIPVGMAFGVGTGNMGLIGVGLPLGFAVGIAIGRRLDQKAQDEGRQLDIDLA